MFAARVAGSGTTVPPFAFVDGAFKSNLLRIPRVLHNRRTRREFLLVRFGTPPTNLYGTQLLAGRPRKFETCCSELLHPRIFHGTLLVSLSLQLYSFSNPPINLQ